MNRELEKRMKELGTDDDKLCQNEEEVKAINNELLERAENILNEFGPEGAYKMSEFLQTIADKDIKQGIAQE